MLIYICTMTLVSSDPVTEELSMSLSPHPQAQRAPTTAEPSESSTKAHVFSVDEVGEKTVL